MFLVLSCLSQTQRSLHTTLHPSVTPQSAALSTSRLIVKPAGSLSPKGCYALVNETHQLDLDLEMLVFLGQQSFLLRFHHLPAV